MVGQSQDHPRGAECEGAKPQGGSSGSIFMWIERKISRASWLKQRRDYTDLVGVCKMEE